MMRNLKSLSAAAFALLFLAACGSSGMGDILGGGRDSGRMGSHEIRGTVESVDRNSRSIYLTNVSGHNTSMLSSGGNTVRVYYDERTGVEYQGTVYRPEDLERGDQVAVRVDESRGALMAESMTVLHNVSAARGTSPYPSGGSDSNIRGTVRYVDTSRRTLEIDRGYGSSVVIEYDMNTPVYFNNQTYRVADLERGDEIDVRVSDLGRGRLMARDISVTRNISGGSGTYGTTDRASTLRGTVRYVDTRNRTIELDSASWVSRFDRGGGTLGNRVVVQYSANAGVELGGQLHPVANLEAGDVIDVEVRNSGASTLFAERIFLIRDVRGR